VARVLTQKGLKRPSTCGDRRPRVTKNLYPRRGHLLNADRAIRKREPHGKGVLLTSKILTSALSNPSLGSMNQGGSTRNSHLTEKPARKEPGGYFPPQFLIFRGQAPEKTGTRRGEEKAETDTSSDSVDHAGKGSARCKETRGSPSASR